MRKNDMTKDLLTTARERELGAYLVALDSAGLRSELETKGPFTLFIPLDAAFERFSTSELDAFDADFDALRRLMQYTIVRGALASDSLARLDSVETLGGEPLEITVANGLEVNGIKIVEADVECANGVVHILAETPIPPSLRGLVRPEMLAPPKDSPESAPTAESPEPSPHSQSSQPSKSPKPSRPSDSSDSPNSTESPNPTVSAQTAETIENDVRNYETDAETARPRRLDKEPHMFAEDLEKTEKDAEAFAEDLRAVEKDAELEATKAETLARGLDAFERKIDDEEEEDEDVGAFERGYERAENAGKTGRDDYYRDLNSHFAENDKKNKRTRVGCGDERREEREKAKREQEERGEADELYAGVRDEIEENTARV
ncbi:MAG: fasciclin domain-containing protein [Thermoguttaceae bacterium]|nr:fasciclin domain-containing protein [Thermoguttaceae bacterium]